MTPRLRSLSGLSLSGFHRVAYWEWDPAPGGAAVGGRTVVCVHGLTRQGRDFDVLAEALARRGRRVVCPDLVGRGRSGWLGDPAGYTLVQYGADMNALLARLDVGEVDWVGTSLGGLVGMVLAGQPGSPVRRLVMNDIGPFIPGAALRRIGAYLNVPPPRFRGPAEAVAYFRETLAPYGVLTDEQWAHLTEHSVREGDVGGYRLRCDPAVGLAYRPWHLGNVAMWEYWDKVACPTLVLRGALSDLLLRPTALEMARRGPRADVLEFQGVGHVPVLMDADQVEPVLGFLA